MTVLDIRIEKGYDSELVREDSEEGIVVTNEVMYWDLYIDSEFMTRSYMDNPTLDFIGYIGDCFAYRQTHSKEITKNS